MPMFRVVNYDSGLCSNITCVAHVITQLKPAETFDVLWTRRPIGFTYGMPGDKNVWDRFFEPIVCDDGIEPTLVTHHSWRLPPVTTPTPANSYASSRGHRVFRLPRWRQGYHKAWSAWMHPLPHIVQRAESFAEQFRSRRVVAVHFRNPREHSAEDFQGQSVQIDDYIAAAEAEEGDLFFVATDDPVAHDYMKKRWRQRMLSQDVTRDLRGVHRVNKDNGILIGEEVLSDVLLLAKCDVLVHRNSNIVLVACFVNPSLKLKTLFHGTLAT